MKSDSSTLLQSYDWKRQRLIPLSAQADGPYSPSSDLYPGHRDKRNKLAGTNGQQILKPRLRYAHSDFERCPSRSSDTTEISRQQFTSDAENIDLQRSFHSIEPRLSALEANMKSICAAVTALDKKLNTIEGAEHE